LSLCPWKPQRVVGSQLSRALDRSLERMGRESIDLYYLHFPYSLVGMAVWVRALAGAVRSGRVRAVGVSNCSGAQMRRAAEILGRHEIPLAANQVQYSLRHRKPETDGVLDACRALDVALVAYRPIGGGKIPTGTGRVGELARSSERWRRATGPLPPRWLCAGWSSGMTTWWPSPAPAGPSTPGRTPAPLGFELSADEFSAIDRASSPVGRGDH
jgi:aryl-alcohol dehydrogenase-like predicted oxidoreductase